MELYGNEYYMALKTGEFREVRRMYRWHVTQKVTAALRKAGLPYHQFVNTHDWDGRAVSEVWVLLDKRS